MTETYGSVAEGRRLLRREREPISGRLARTRDEKGRGPQRPGRPSRRAVVAGALVLGLGLAAAAVTATVAGDGSSEDSEAERDTTATSTTLPPVSAISLIYSGGSYTRQECTDLLAVGACSQIEYSNLAEQLSVRCTPEGCELSYGGESFPLDGPLETSGTLPHGGPECGTQSWTLQLEPVGEATTHGIQHPARLRGRSTTTAPASLPPGTNCLGRDEVYEVDATPE